MEIQYGNITSNSQLSGSTSNINKNVGISTQGDLSGLKEGNVFKGEVLDIKGSHVTIGLENGQTVTAKLESDIPINIGQTLLFEVKSKSSSQIQIRPAGDNTGEQPIIQKALTEAGIPRDERTLAMINSMLKEGMSVDKQSLHNILRQLKAFNQTSPDTIVKMNKLGILVNEENIEQFENYKNYEHRLVKGIDTTAGSLSSLVSELAGEDIDKGIEFNNKLIDILNNNLKPEENIQSENKTSNSQMENIDIPIESNENAQKSPQDLTGKAADVPAQEAPNSESIDITENIENAKNTANAENKENVKNQDSLEQLKDEAVSGKSDENLAARSASENKEIDKAETMLKGAILDSGEVAAKEAETLSGKASEPAIKDEAENIIKGKEAGLSKELVGNVLDKEARAVLSDKLSDMGLDKETVLNVKDGEIGNKELLNIVKELLKNPENTYKAESLLGSREYREVLLNAIKHEWLIKPESLKEQDKVTRFYNQLQEQTRQLQSVLESVGKENTSSFKELGNMKNNLDFMNQLNQEYTYLQLPVQFTNEETHSDLYVYTNKKNMRERKDELSVLLHLDMEVLGTTEVFITLKGNKVNAKFTLDNSRSIEIVENNMELLIQRLKKSGYDALATVDKLEKETDFVEDFLEKDKPVTSLKRYMFDVRA